MTKSHDEKIVRNMLRVPVTQHEEIYRSVAEALRASGCSSESIEAALARVRRNVSERCVDLSEGDMESKWMKLRHFIIRCWEREQAKEEKRMSIAGRSEQVLEQFRREQHADLTARLRFFRKRFEEIHR